MSDSKYLRPSIEENLPPYPDFAAALPCNTNTLVGLIIDVAGTLFGRKM